MKARLEALSARWRHSRQFDRGKPALLPAQQCYLKCAVDCDCDWINGLAVRRVHVRAPYYPSIVSRMRDLQISASESSAAGSTYPCRCTLETTYPFHSLVEDCFRKARIDWFKLKRVPSVWEELSCEPHRRPCAHVLVARIAR